MGHPASSSVTAARSPLRRPYDNDGRQTKITTPAGRTVTTTWDNASRITTEVATATGRTATTRTYTYDSANRVLTAASSGDGTATSLTYTYNSRGLLATSKDATGTATVSWDIAHLLWTLAMGVGSVSSLGAGGSGRSAAHSDQLIGHAQLGCCPARANLAEAAGILEEATARFQIRDVVGVEDVVNVAVAGESG